MTEQTGHMLETEIVKLVFPSVADDHKEGNVGSSSTLKTFVFAVYTSRYCISEKVKDIDGD